MKLTSVLASAVLAGAAFVAQPALAADLSHPPQALMLVDGSAGFSASFAAGNYNNTFLDRYTFSVADPEGARVDALVGSIARSDLVGLEINGFYLYDSMNMLMGGGVMQQAGTIDLWTISTPGGLPLGDYSVIVAGRLVSDVAGSYGGNLNLAPVPEPDTAAMLAAGLGVLGVVLRRRKQTPA